MSRCEASSSGRSAQAGGASSSTPLRVRRSGRRRPPLGMVTQPTGSDREHSFLQELLCQFDPSF